LLLCEHCSTEVDDTQFSVTQRRGEDLTSCERAEIEKLYITQSGPFHVMLSVAKDNFQLAPIYLQRAHPLNRVCRNNIPFNICITSQEFFQLAGLTVNDHVITVLNMRPSKWINLGRCGDFVHHNTTHICLRLEMYHKGRSLGITTINFEVNAPAETTTDPLRLNLLSMS
jgi:hypothetical protein